MNNGFTQSQYALIMIYIIRILQRFSSCDPIGQVDSGLDQLFHHCAMLAHMSVDAHCLWNEPSNSNSVWPNKASRPGFICPSGSTLLPSGDGVRCAVMEMSLADLATG